MINDALVLNFDNQWVPFANSNDEFYIEDDYDTVSYECAQFMIDLAIEEHNILQATILGDMTELVTESITAGLVIVIGALAALITAVIAKVISIFTNGASISGATSELNKAQKALDKGDLEAAGNHVRKSAEHMQGNSKTITDLDVLISKFGKDIKYDEPIYISKVPEHVIGYNIDRDIDFTGKVISLTKYFNELQEYMNKYLNNTVKDTEADKMLKSQDEYEALVEKINNVSDKDFSFLNKIEYFKAGSYQGIGDKDSFSLFMSNGLTYKSISKGRTEELKKTESMLLKEVDKMKTLAEKMSHMDFKNDKDKLEKDLQEVQQDCNETKSMITKMFSNYVKCYSTVIHILNTSIKTYWKTRKQYFDNCVEAATKAGYTVEVKYTTALVI